MCSAPTPAMTQKILVCIAQLGRGGALTWVDGINVIATKACG